MWEQTKIEDFVDGKLQIKVAKPKVQEPERKSTLEQILERLERIETMLEAGQVTASISVSRPALAGGPPIRSSLTPIESRRKASAQATELKELMGVEEGEIYLGTPREILAALRNRK